MSQLIGVLSAATEDLRYLRIRAAEEGERASAATSPTIRAIHLEFAIRYDQMAGQLRRLEELRGSRDTIRRSLDLLSATARQL